MESAEEFAKHLLGRHEVLSKVAGSECATRETTLEVEADRTAVALAIFDELESAMAGFYKRNPEHAWTQVLPTTIREMRARYQKVKTDG